MTRVLLGLGSNESWNGMASEALLDGAVAALRRVLSRVEVSSIYKTRAMYVEDQDDFYNMALLGFAREGMGARDLLCEIHKIESAFGRDRAREIRNGPRPIDIDIELFGSLKTRDEALEIPHPRLRERAFVLVPALEILDKTEDAEWRADFSKWLSALDASGVALWRSAPPKFPAGRVNLEKICVILARPENSMNVGAVCRAMANSAIHDLRVVGNRADYDDGKVRALAIDAAPIWEGARFFPSITEAASDCALSAGTTRRRGKNRKGKLFLPEEFSRQAAGISGGEKGARVAVVFGNERAGLSDAELDECAIGVTIPASEEFMSLNLSHAVQIICYQLFRESRGQIAGYTPVALSRIDETVRRVADSLRDIGFFSVTGREDMERFWRELLARASLSEGDAKYIEKIFTKAAGLARKRSAR